MRNLHLPIPDDLHDELRARSTASNRPMTALVREAIAAWLVAEKRAAVESELRAYVERWAGTEVDRDDELIAAGVEAIRES